MVAAGTRPHDSVTPNLYQEKTFWEDSQREEETWLLLLLLLAVFKSDCGLSLPSSDSLTSTPTAARNKTDQQRKVVVLETEASLPETTDLQPERQTERTQVNNRCSARQTGK